MTFSLGQLRFFVMRSPVIFILRSVAFFLHLTIPTLYADETPDYLSAAFDANRDYWERTLRSKNYEEATAADPMFEDTTLWPGLSGKERFLAPKWQKGRQVTWAHPGENGDQHGHNPFDLANWLIDGSPADRVISDIEQLFSEMTDVVFPASDTRYSVNIRQESHGTKELRNQVFRNLTVEENAYFKSGGDGIGCRIYGNVWVKRYAGFYGQGTSRLLDSRSTFFRNDNGWGSPGGLIYQSIQVEKDSSESVEFFGDMAVNRLFSVHTGTAIIGAKSRLRFAFGEIERNGTLVLMDAGIFSCRLNKFTESDIHVAGSVSGGIPERPLAKDAWFAVSFKNHERRHYGGQGRPMDKGRAIPMVRVPSMVIEPTARFESHVAPNSDARLIITSTATDDGSYRPAAYSKLEKHLLSINPDRAKFYGWYDGLPHGISVFVPAGAVFKGIRFDHFAKGGILTTQPSVSGQWSGVDFGEGNAAKGNELFSEINGLGQDGSY